LGTYKHTAQTAILFSASQKQLKHYDGGAVKVFVYNNGVKVTEEAWSKIRRRGFMSKTVKAQTQDKKPSKP